MSWHNRLLGGSMFIQPLRAPEAEGGGAAPAAPAAPAAAAAPAAPAPDKPAAPAAPVAPAAAATLAGGAASDPAAAGAAAAAALKPGALPADFDFRKWLAGDDANALKDLEKYTDGRAVYQSLRDLQAKISKGELKAAPKPLPANATDEQKAEWRKSNGLPDSAETMVKGLKLPDGVVVGEADKPLVEQFAKSLYEAGGSQDEMNRAVSFYYGLQDQAKAQQAELDSQSRVATEVALREEMKGDFTGNMNAVASVGALLGEETWNALLTARDSEGRMLGNTVAFNKAMAQLAREINPAATIIPNDGGNAAQTIDSEIAKIEGTMYVNGQPNQAYWNDQKAQARLRELYDARDAMAKRGKAA